MGRHRIDASTDIRVRTDGNSTLQNLSDARVRLTLSGLQVLRAAVPDLLDRSAGQADQRAIDEVLAGHAESYARVQRIRSRRAGHTAFVEIALEFEPGLDFAEVDRRLVSLKTALRERLDNADIAILASAAVG